ncbi:hypothetical protein X798_02610 [Onchocerca flexuosa]|uniref:Transposase n=2 Tax=Onchocerca flexuosa TaxID=387005 RepID=A0A183I265_9BILA|nr:hypothetical protein X798_02610 [Onchocerca flexuosa]VDP14765.1 unnamed protein product [Onchocerca flexuosa]
MPKLQIADAKRLSALRFAGNLRTEHLHPRYRPSEPFPQTESPYPSITALLQKTLRGALKPGRVKFQWQYCLLMMWLLICEWTVRRGLGILRGDRISVISIVRGEVCDSESFIKSHQRSWLMGVDNTMQ